VFEPGIAVTKIIRDEFAPPDKAHRELFDLLFYQGRFIAAFRD